MSKDFVGASAITVFLSQALAVFGTPAASKSRVLSEIAFSSILIQWIVLIHASGLLGNQRTEKFFDLTGACTFFLLILWSIKSVGLDMLSVRQQLASMGVLIWCSRLGYFLFSRSLNEGGIDSRFTEVKKSIYRFATFWTIQGLWVFIVALPVFMLNATELPYDDSLGPLGWLGLLLWVSGFVMEVVADEQKRSWRHQKGNHGRFIDSGLWSVSRHPNYFGEICIWVGMYLLCFGGFASTVQKVLGILSPLFTFLLLVFVSGIPLLERAADKRWREDAAYKAYKQTTPVLIPFIGRTGSASF